MSSSAVDPRTYVLEDSPGRGLRVGRGAPWLRRRGWVMLISLVVVVLVAVVVGERKPVTYSADAKVQVTTGAQGPIQGNAATPGSAYEGQALAADYAGLIDNDAGILSKVSAATGLSPTTVASSTTVSVINGTALLDIKFTSSTPDTAKVGATALAQAISGKNPVSPAIAPETVTITQLPSVVVRHVTKLPVIVAIGVVLGLLLGAVLLIAWERADARFDRPGQISGTLAIPARALSDLNALSAIALMERWRDLAHHKPARVAFVPSAAGMTAETHELVGRLGLIGHFAPITVRTSLDEFVPDGGHPGIGLGSEPAMGELNLAGQSPSPAQPPSANGTDVLLKAGGAPGAEGGEAAAVEADLTVLVVPRGSRVSDAQQSLVLLEQVGIRPQWALMVDLGRMRPTQAGQFGLQPFSPNGVENGNGVPLVSLHRVDEAD